LKFNITSWSLTVYLGIIAALIGLLLRSYFVWPQAFNFRFMLHAHSHAMLLAWLLGALILIIYQQWEIKLSQSTKILFNGLALSVVGMLCSFPFQGYAAISISFSTLHLWLSYALFYRLFRALKNRGPSAKLLRTGILLFYLSSLGPYCLGPLMANEMQSSPWYDQAIYFYLHFLYNGSFFFFLLAIIVHKLKLFSDEKEFQHFYLPMLWGSIFSYALNLEYSFDQSWIYLLAALGSSAQLYAGIRFIKAVFRIRISNHLKLILFLLFFKWIFQILGSTPLIAEQIQFNRFLLIAYLHFIFLGIYTPFIWEMLKRRIPAFNKWMIAYWLLFILSEIALIAPSLKLIPGFQSWPILTFYIYAGLVSIWLILAFSYLKNLRRNTSYHLESNY